METLVEFIGTILIEVLQELWPPVLAILDGALVLLFAFLTYLYYTTSHPFKAVVSLLAAILFLVVLIVGCRSGVFAPRTTKKGRRK